MFKVKFKPGTWDINWKYFDFDKNLNIYRLGGLKSGKYEWQYVSKFKGKKGWMNEETCFKMKVLHN